MFVLPFPTSKTTFPYTRPFLKSGALSVPNVVSTVWLDLADNTMAGNERGLLNLVGLEVEDNGAAYSYASASLAFRIVVSGGAPSGWEEYTSKRGSIELPTETLILVNPGNRVQFQVRRALATDTGTRRINAIINGIKWSSTIKDFRDDPFLSGLPAEAAAAIVR